MERYHLASVSALIAGGVFAVLLWEALALLTYQRIGFDLMFRRGQMQLRALPLLVMIGPIIILRETQAMAPEAEYPLLVWILGLDLAAGWALASGHLLLRIINLVVS